MLLSPIFDDRYRLIYEFQRAYILSVNRRGQLETRLVAVHPILGVVGTKTVHRFETRFSGLAHRCMDHLSGAAELFPVPDRPAYTARIRVPPGEADLSFDPSVKDPGRNGPTIEASGEPGEPSSLPALGLPSEAGELP